MTSEQIDELGPAFADYLEPFLFCCAYTQTFDLLGVYCRGLLADLPRKTCEPLALYAGVAVRTLQEFLRDHRWSFADVRTLLQQHVAAQLRTRPADDVGTVGIVDETGTRKKGTQTPGVQRQYCGELGKTENCIVTVHLGVARDRSKTLIDADLFLPQAWDADRDRCRAAGIPDDVHYRPKWQIALEELDRARANGVAFDWLTFDEGYGDKPGFLQGLGNRHLAYVGEVPKSFRCRAPGARGRRASRADDLVRHSPLFTRQPWRSFRLERQTLGAQEWEAKAARVRLAFGGKRTYWLIGARNVRTGEEKSFMSNAPARAALGRLLRVAFRRWNIEHAIRLSKSEIGLRHFEGRNYVALMRHLTLCLVTMTFVAGQAERLRGEKSGGDDGAGVRGTQRGVRRLAGSAARDESAGVHIGSHWLSPAA
ncbi:MAG: IS701 family transposase [Streptosporangiaceae bacterium]|nr:IS701 family transposase [Streptosporangiaceae bacterium]